MKERIPERNLYSVYTSHLSMMNSVLFSGGPCCCTGSAHTTSSLPVDDWNCIIKPGLHGQPLSPRAALFSISSVLLSISTPHKPVTFVTGGSCMASWWPRWLSCRRCPQMYVRWPRNSSRLARSTEKKVIDYSHNYFTEKCNSLHWQ